MGGGKNSVSASVAGAEINGVFVSLSLCLRLQLGWAGKGKGKDDTRQWRRDGGHLGSEREVTEGFC